MLLDKIDFYFGIYLISFGGYVMKSAKKKTFSYFYIIITNTKQQGKYQ